MNKKVLFLVGLVVISFASISLISATCTVTFDRQIPTQYAPTEDISAAMVCDNKNEEADAYTLTWTNSSGDTIQTNTGTTPKPKNQYFYEEYRIPSTYLGNITATLTGTDLEGDDIANVSGASASSLIISDAVAGGSTDCWKPSGNDCIWEGFINACPDGYFDSFESCINSISAEQEADSWWAKLIDAGKNVVADIKDKFSNDCVGDVCDLDDAQEEGTHRGIWLFICAIIIILILYGTFNPKKSEYN